MDVLAFQLLGTMLINGRPATEILPGARARQLLATLLQHPNRFVSFDTIIDNLWNERPPKSAAANLRTHVGAVRRALAVAEVPAELQTRTGGYLIKVAPQLLDTSRLDELLVEAHHLAAADDHDGALALVDEALALWRGSPFEDLELCSAWQPQITRWEQSHAELVTLAVELHAAHGDPWRAAALIRVRLESDPYDEASWAQLARCYLTGGMIGQAVQALTEARRVLADELGVEPGPELQQLEAQVRDDPEESGLTRLPVSATPGKLGPAPTVPSQLPHDLPDFSGRTEELDRVLGLLRRRPDGRPAVVVVTGPPGVGKTAFVTHAAHRLRDTFPDGQVYLDLRGTTTPLSAPFAVTEVLAAIGISNPSDELGRAAALLRSELASRRLLLVVDNAANAEQIIPLLPGTGDSAVLVTSRRRLTGVTGADVIAMDVLSIDDATEMVQRVAGLEDPKDQLRLAEACGCHPLALRIACGRLARRPDLSVRALAARLNDPGRALDELTLGEEAFRTSAQLSCAALGDRAARAFRTLGSLELTEFSGLTVEIAAGGSCAAVEELLEENLLRVDRAPGGQVSYVMHDLLRWHARSWAAALGEDSAAQVGQIVAGWVAVSARAARALPTTYLGPLPEVADQPLDPAWADLVEDPTGAWFDAERQRLDAMLASALEHGWVEPAWKLAVCWSPYFDLRGHTRAWLSALEKVLGPVREAGDRIGEATLLQDMGQVFLYRDDLAEATQALTTARDLFVQAGDWDGAGYTTIRLGAAAGHQGRDADVLEHGLRGTEYFERTGNRLGLAAAHNVIALHHLSRQDYDRAEPWLDSAAAIALETGDRHRQAQILRRRAEMHLGRQESAAAQALLGEALDIFLALGDHRCAGYASTRLGRLKLAAGDCPGARRQFREALEAARRLADPAAQAAAWDALADALIDESRQQAVDCLQRSVRAWQVADRPAKAAESAARLARLREAVATVS